MTPCPDLKTLEQFCAGETPPDQVLEINNHLISCEVCAETLERLSREGLRTLAFEVLAANTPRGRPVAPGYEILEPLGAGGMGEVWKGRQITLGRLVALKFMGNRLAASSELRERFRFEAEAVARLQHPNIVQVFEARGDAATGAFFSMELLTGGSLKQRLDGRPLPPEESAKLLRTLARAIAHAHDRGIVHRDLKPTNVLFAADGTPRVTDFGLAKILDAEDPATRTGQIMGTPEYMSPEQTHGTVGPLADVYALGVILYECLTGRLPFRGVNKLDTLALVRDSEPVSPRMLVASVTTDLETITLKCLSKKPEDRYESAAALADDLDRYLNGQPIVARPPSWVYQFRKFTARRKVLVGGLTATVASMTAGLIGTTTALAQAHREKADREKAEGERETAEQQARARQAELLFTTGQNALQRGQWRDALVLVQESLSAGFSKPVQAKLLQIKAWYALNQMNDPEKRAVLDQLQHEPDFQEQKASVLLVQGDVLIGHDNAKGIEFIREALNQGGLSLADTAYAKALLGEIIPDVLKHCDVAIAAEPSHYRARLMRFMCWFLSGHLDRARQESEVMRDFFAADPTVLGVQMMMDAVQGRRSEVTRQIKLIEEQWDKERVDLFRIAIVLLEELVILDPWSPEPPNRRMPRLMTRLNELGLNLFQFVAIQGKPSALASLANLLPSVPPMLVDTLGEAIPAMIRLGQRQQKDEIRPFAEMLERAVSKLPEGTLLLMLGLARASLREHAIAEPWFRKAAVAPSIKPVRKLSLFVAAKCAWFTGVTDQNPPDPDAVVRIRTYYLELLNEQDIPVYMYPQMIDHAAESLNYDLARQIAFTFGMRHPEEPSWRYHLALVESRAGDHVVAIRLFDELLANKPPENLKKQVQEKYEEWKQKSKEQVKRLLGA